MSTITISSPIYISDFQFLVENKPNTAVASDIFSYDIDLDGNQEIIFAGRETQPATIDTWSNSTIHIFDEINGTWVEVTESLLADNIIEGTEPAVLFGDFNGDGAVDFVTPGDTDMDYLVPTYLFLNTENGFEKHSYDPQAWIHGAYAADINNDGYDDIVSTDYGPNTGVFFGGENGLTFYSVEGRGVNSISGISSADFLGDGSMTIITTDGAMGTSLYSWNIDNEDKLSFEKISDLPAGRFTLPQWNYLDSSDPSNPSHDVRVVPFEFSGDNLIDMIVMSRPWLTNSGDWPEYSEIQFLENKGLGIFEDVTDARLINYEQASNISYQPVFLDVNNDGRTDIFLSAADFSEYNSTAVLLQQIDGTFIDTGRSQFTLLWDEIITESQNSTNDYVYTGWGQTMHLTTNNDGQLNVITSIPTIKNDGVSNMVFSALVTFERGELNEEISSTNENDSFNGALGIDTAIYSAERVNYSILISSDTTTITDNTSSDGVDTLTAFERIQFSDTHLAIDLDGNAGQAYRIYKAAFDRAPDLGGLGFWINALDNGASLTSMASGFTNSVEFESLYGSNNTNKDFVNLMYNNVLDRDADEGGYDFWLGHMDSGAVSREQLLMDFSESNENQLNVIGLISNGIEYTEWVG